MINLTINQLRAGMRFSKPLISSEGDTVLREKKSITEQDLKDWTRKGLFDFLTYGDVIEDGSNAAEVDVGNIQQIREAFEKEKTKMREEISQPEKLAQTESDAIQNRIALVEARIDRLELLEQLIESFSTVLSAFIKDTTRAPIFIEKVKHIVEILRTELKNDHKPFLEIISHLEFGSHFISHSIKTTIIAIYLLLEKKIGPRKVVTIGMGALLHDLGKLTYQWINEMENLKVPRDRLNLPISHPIYGYKTAKHILSLPDDTCCAILNHHEQPDGKGFPRSIKGIKLNEFDRVVFMANLVENLFSKNSYSGYQIVVDQIEHLHNKYPDKFDGALVQSLSYLKDY